MTALFSRETLDFLIENRLQNSRPWFEAHREQYEKHVIAPLVSLAENLAPALSDIDEKLICIPKVGGSVSRIWRDARFSKDKSIFRDAMWCMFVRQKNIGLPEFFFVVTPRNFLYGCGYYSAGAASMESIRKLVLAGGKDFSDALSAYNAQDTFKIDGDMYKKSRHPDAPEEKRQWLDRKTICFIRETDDFGLLFSSGLAAEVSESFRKIAPVYHFLIKAEERVTNRAAAPR